MVDELLSSGAIDNQSLGVTLMRSDRMTDEDRKKHIDKFVEDYNSGKINYLDEERKDLLTAWIELYQTTVKDAVKNRVKKIT